MDIFLQRILNLFVSFFGSSFFELYGTLFIAAFALLWVIKGVGLIVRSY